MSYWPARHAAVLVGGSAAAMYNDTWTFKRGQWTKVASSCFRSSCMPEPTAVAHDGHGLIAYVGRPAQTWAFVNGKWQRAQSSATPSDRVGAAMVSASIHSRVLLFGGQMYATGQPNNLTNECWAWLGPARAG